MSEVRYRFYIVDAITLVCEKSGATLLVLWGLIVGKQTTYQNIILNRSRC